MILPYCLSMAAMNQPSAVPKLIVIPPYPDYTAGALYKKMGKYFFPAKTSKGLRVPAKSIEDLTDLYLRDRILQAGIVCTR